MPRLLTATLAALRGAKTPEPEVLLRCDPNPATHRGAAQPADRRSSWQLRLGGDVAS